MKNLPKPPCIKFNKEMEWILTMEVIYLESCCPIEMRPCLVEDEDYYWDEIWQNHDD